MMIYPAIDIIGGKCVRLTQGDYSKIDTYYDDPVQMAYRFEEIGAEYIHVVDLDGARLGEPVNLGTASRIAVNASVPVQLGGGIRTIDDIEIALNKGIHRVILGTAAVRDPKFVQEAINDFDEAIAIAVDAKNGKVAISGWEEISGEDAIEFAKLMEKLGVKTIIYTDVLKDGMLSGPNFCEIKKLTSAVKIDVIAAGGVSNIDDIKKLKDTGVKGAIIGKAVYTGDINLAEALEIAGE